METDSAYDTTNGSITYKVVFVTIVIIASLGSAIYSASQTLVLLSRGKVVSAICTNVEYVNRNKRSPIWYISFPTDFEKFHETTIDASFAGLKTGDTIEVIFDPLYPNNVRPFRILSLWGWPVLASFVFVTFFFELNRLRKRIPRQGEPISLSQSE